MEHRPLQKRSIGQLVGRAQTCCTYLAGHRERHDRLPRNGADDVVTRHQTADAIDAAIVGQRASSRHIAAIPHDDRPPVGLDAHPDQTFANFVDDGSRDRGVPPDANRCIPSTLAIAKLQRLRRPARTRAAVGAVDISGFSCDDPVAATSQITEHEPAVLAGEQPGRRRTAAPGRTGQRDDGVVHRTSAFAVHDLPDDHSADRVGDARRPRHLKSERQTDDEKRTKHDDPRSARWRNGL